MTEELWQVLGGSGSIHLSGWPEVGKIMAEEMTVIVQVNGKMRGVWFYRPRTAGMKRRWPKGRFSTRRWRSGLVGNIRWCLCQVG